VLLYAAPLLAQAPDRTLDPNSQVRILAYRQLGDQQSAGSLELLALRLSQEGDPAARVAALNAIGRLALGFDELTQALDGSTSPYARAWAAHALGNYPGLATVQVLMAAADDPEERVRREVFEALGRLGDPLALKILTKAAVRDPSAELRRLADRSAHRVVKGPRQSIDVPTQLALLAAGDVPERVLAARSLGASGDWRVFQPLLHATTTRSTDVRIAAVTALGILGDRRAVPRLHDLARTAEGSLRYHAIAALAHLEDESSRPVLIKLLADPDPETRKFAVRALGWIKGEGVLAALSAVLDDPQVAVRTEVVQQLRDLEGPDLADVVLQAVNDPEPVIRAEATRLLAGLADPRINTVLVQLLDDSDVLVRLSATDTLVNRGVHEARPRLQELVRRAQSPEERKLYEDALTALHED
jgi:HEAT repeat protein